MKKEYLAPVLQLLYLKTEDIMTASEDDAAGDDLYEDDFD